MHGICPTPAPRGLVFSLFPPPPPITTIDRFPHSTQERVCVIEIEGKLLSRCLRDQPIRSSKKALFLLILFSPLSDPPKRCDFNGVHYNLGDTWNPFLLPSGYFRCIKCACKLVGIPCHCEKYVKGDESTEIILISLVDLLGKTFAGITV